MREDTSFTFLPEIERNIGSLYTTLGLLLRTEQYDTALRLAHTVYPYWEAYEYLSEGVDWLQKFVGPSSKGGYDPESLSGIYHMLGNLLRHQSEYPVSTNFYELGLGNLSTQPGHHLHTSILSGLGETAFRQGKYDDATTIYKNHLALSQQANDGRRIADSMNALGRLATVKGDMVEALDYHNYGQALCAQYGYETGRGWWLNAMGELERARGAHHKAVDYFYGSAAIFERQGNTGIHMLVLQNLAFIALPNDPARAEQLFRQVLAFWMRGPAKHGMAVCLVGLSKVEISKGNTRTAATLLCVASHLLNQSGARLELGDSNDYETALNIVQKRLGYSSYAEMHEAIGQLSTQELIGLAARPNLPTSTRQLSSPTLTPRETGLLSLAAQGLTDKQIAQKLVISPHTVNAHLKSIYQKLAVSNRMAAVAVARQQRLI